MKPTAISIENSAINDDKQAPFIAPNIDVVIPQAIINIPKQENTIFDPAKSCKIPATTSSAINPSPQPETIEIRIKNKSINPTVASV
ncbi:hypothetical protein [Phormidium tenue]|uniref:Uncharacterized protein n=1 Tax=Phormidium tenue FACHB-1050 TaxID=2692857 RepID=A0ABR8C7Y1_9CYAN|nr:hypothetical protein [Phormidium tenue]MBD2316893.1 hypothetical protein [Phormidium tenue FACHB-1050]